MVRVLTNHHRKKFRFRFVRTRTGAFGVPAIALHQIEATEAENE